MQKFEYADELFRVKRTPFFVFRLMVTRITSPASSHAAGSINDEPWAKTVSNSSSSSRRERARSN